MLATTWSATLIRSPRSMPHDSTDDVDVRVYCGELGAEVGLHRCGLLVDLLCKEAVLAVAHCGIL